VTRFTGKERDAETGLDYFGARYLSSAQGRFTSPDEPLLDHDPAENKEGASYEQLGKAPTGARGKRREMSMKISPQQSFGEMI
jgi:RHS repeat-associated protein